MAKPPVVEQVQVNFRMPADLRDRIRAASQEAGRSMNAEIIFALEAAYPAPGRVFDEARAILARLRQDATAYADWSRKPMAERLEFVTAELAARGFDVDDGVKLGIVLNLFSEGLPKISAAEAAERRARDKP
jgi:uncharacterized protein (DUF1778 family)